MATTTLAPHPLANNDGVDIDNVIHTESVMTATLKSSSSLHLVGVSLNAETLCNGLSSIAHQNF